MWVFPLKFGCLVTLLPLLAASGTLPSPAPGPSSTARPAAPPPPETETSWCASCPGTCRAAPPLLRKCARQTVSHQCCILNSGRKVDWKSDQDLLVLFFFFSYQKNCLFSVLKSVRCFFSTGNLWRDPLCRKCNNNIIKSGGVTTLPQNCHTWTLHKRSDISLLFFFRPLAVRVWQSPQRFTLFSPLFIFKGLFI